MIFYLLISSFHTNDIHHEHFCPSMDLNWAVFKLRGKVFNMQHIDILTICKEYYSNESLAQILLNIGRSKCTRVFNLMSESNRLETPLWPTVSPNPLVFINTFITGFTPSSLTTLSML
ncbi:unnamed protein product, partial [Vitis vinifera]|uniref:Uncharacterized protein n=1 Tax=Vitis vinifera TaxID=29760 RepID=D7STA0_VITVI